MNYDVARDTKAEDLNLRGVLEKKHYSVDYYQRDYAWGKERSFRFARRFFHQI